MKHIWHFFSCNQRKVYLFNALTSSKELRLEQRGIPYRTNQEDENTAPPSLFFFVFCKWWFYNLKWIPDNSAPNFWTCGSEERSFMVGVNFMVVAFERSVWYLGDIYATWAVSCEHIMIIHDHFCTWTCETIRHVLKKQFYNYKQLVVVVVHSAILSPFHTAWKPYIILGRRGSFWHHERVGAFGICGSAHLQYEQYPVLSRKKITWCHGWQCKIWELGKHFKKPEEPEQS